MVNSIQSIDLDKLIAHPDNPNRQSKANFAKLVRNIKQSGRYEPIVVRRHGARENCFQIINGHHRCRALEKIGYSKVDCLVWDVDDEQTDILLATLNRLGGIDIVAKKTALLKRLREKNESAELSRLLPQTAKQIERLIELGRPNLKLVEGQMSGTCFGNPMVFFLDDSQRQTVDNAFSLVKPSEKAKTKAARNAASLVEIAQYFLENVTLPLEVQDNG